MATTSKQLYPSVTSDMYAHLEELAKDHGCLKDNGDPNVSRFTYELLRMLLNIDNRRKLVNGENQGGMLLTEFVTSGVQGLLNLNSDDDNKKASQHRRLN